MNAAIDSPAAADAGSADTVPVTRVDFYRPLVCILGLPFDAISLTEAVERVRRDAFARRRCFLSTPNLNFAIAARSDAEFRDSVLRSDLSLVDGMPLVWISRLLQLPVPERVSGADLFEALQAHAGPPLSVYLFGGPAGAAALACERINHRGGGMRCVGFDSPGFESIESMSSPEQIARINRSGAQFVIVALGAKKGQAWIEHNAARLVAPVLSHLGAVVNFAGGTVRRAPRWIQQSGLEWAWRIKEEPVLWRRYCKDALELAALLMMRVLPDALTWREHGACNRPPPTLDVLTSGRETLLKLRGCWSNDTLPLRSALSRCTAIDSRVTVDVSGVSEIGATCIAILLVARGWLGARGSFKLIGASADIRRSLLRKSADLLLC